MAKKPILFCGFPDGDVSELLKYTDSGRTCVTVKDIVEYMESVKDQTSNLQFLNIKEYTRLNQTKNLFAILKQIYEAKTAV